MSNFAVGIIYAMDRVLDLVNLLIFIRVILSWFNINYYSGIGLVLYQLTEPILAPFRGLVDRLRFNMMLDLTPFVAVFTINGVYQLLIRNMLIRLLF